MSGASERIFDGAYQGAPGAFSEEAAFSLAGATRRLLACARFEEVFDAVESGRARLGIVPVENTLAGPVRQTAALLSSRLVVVVGETRLRISHTLVAAPGVSRDAIRRASSHPVALAQCSNFFLRHPHIEPFADFDTAGAVARVVRARARDEAAIASSRAAAIYGAEILEERLEDSPENFTTFVAIAQASR
jgi:prephenate dehydratase